MENVLNSILSKELIFLIKYLEKKRGYRERFDQLIINANGFESNLDDFMDCALAILGKTYVNTIKKTNKYYILELTEKGLEITNYISYPNQIIRRDLIWKTILFFAEILNWIVVKPIKFIPKLSRVIFSYKLAKIILFIMALLGGAVASIQLYKFYKTGEI